MLSQTAVNVWETPADVSVINIPNYRFTQFPLTFIKTSFENHLLLVEGVDFTQRRVARRRQKLKVTNEQNRMSVILNRQSKDYE